MKDASCSQMGVAARWVCGTKGFPIDTLQEIIRMFHTTQAAGKARSSLKGR
jgi:hypothetical protein